MPAGKHKGKRVLVTLDPVTYEMWVEIAKVLKVPLATAIRQQIEESTTLIFNSLVHVESAKARGDTFDDVMGRALWGMMKMMSDVEKRDTLPKEQIDDD